jgi:hypothetical protein
MRGAGSESFVVEGLDGIQPGRADGGIEAKDDADRDRHAEREDDRERRSPCPRAVDADRRWTAGTNRVVLI